MHVFVTGADGFIGTALVPVLLAQGHSVTGLARDADAADRIRAAGATALVADLHVESTIQTYGDSAYGHRALITSDGF